MNTHPELDTLVELEQATSWDAVSTLAHIRDCAQCSQALAELEVIGQAMPAAQPDAGFEEQLRRSMAALRTPQVSVMSRIRAAALIVFPLATACAWLVSIACLWFMDARRPEVPHSPLATAAGALLVGAIATWRTTRNQQPLALES